MSELCLHLSGRTLPGHKACAEYFKSANNRKQTFCVSLDEMGWLIGSGALFKQDADKVMNFLGCIAQSLEAECLKIVPVAEGLYSAKVEIYGKKFPDATASVNLGFFNDPSIVSLNSIITSQSLVFLDRGKYNGTIELQAYDQALCRLETSLIQDQRFAPFKDRFKIEAVVQPEETHLRHQIELHYFGTGPPLTIKEIADGTAVSAEYIQKVVLAARKVPELYNQRISSLVDTLLNAK